MPQGGGALQIDIRPRGGGGPQAVAADLAGAGELGVNIACGQLPRGGGEERKGSTASRTTGASHPSADEMVAGITAPAGTSTLTHMQFGSHNCSPMHTTFRKVPTCPSIASKCCQLRRPQGTPRSSSRQVFLGTGYGSVPRGSR